MKAWVGITDSDWYRFLRDRRHLDEVHFWQPGGGRQFRTLRVGAVTSMKARWESAAVTGIGFYATARSVTRDD